MDSKYNETSNGEPAIGFFERLLIHQQSNNPYFYPNKTKPDVNRQKRI